MIFTSTLNKVISSLISIEKDDYKFNKIKQTIKIDPSYLNLEIIKLF